MPFNPQETSLYSGAPVELFQFQSDDAIERWLLTTGDEDYVDGVTTYRVAPVSRSALTSSTGESQAAIRVEFPADYPLAQKFVAYLPERQINLTIFRYHRTDTIEEKLPIFQGVVSSITFEEGKAVLSCQPLLKVGSRLVPWQSCKALCNWALYGNGCGVLRNSYRLVLPSGPNFVGPGTLVDPAFALQVNGWFTNGYVEVTATRETRFIINHTTDTLSLIAPLANYTPGDEIIVYPGCDRTENTCRDKFNNIQNYLGFNRVPTENPFDTSFSGNGPGGAAGTLNGNLLELLRQFNKG